MGDSGKRTNQVQFVAELAREPRVFKTEKGSQVVNLFVKGDTKRGNVYLPVRVAGDLAEQHIETLVLLDPGDEIAVLGELDWEKWEKNGETKYSTRINAMKLKLPEKRPPEKSGSWESEEELPF